MFLKKILQFSIILFLGLFAFKPASAAITIRPMINMSLIGYWSMDDGTGNKANDSSGNGNDLDLYGATWVDGKRGKALYFDGSNDYAISESNMTITGAGQRTVSFWVKVSSWEDGGSANTPFLYWGSGSSGELNLIGHQYTTGLGFYGYAADTSAAPALTIGDWYHVTMVYNGTAITSYLNGNLNWGPVNLTLNTDASLLNIGRYLLSGGWGNGYFNGYIDEVRVYNRALSATHVADLYNFGSIGIKYKAPTNNGLVGYWSMDEGAGTKAGDSSGRGNNGSLLGAYTITTSGTTNWEAPAGVTSVQVELWGGGGAGGGNNFGTAGGGGGGAGGAYAASTVSVTPGNSYQVVVAAIKAGTYQDGGQGNDSTFNGSTVVAKGGPGGYAWQNGAAAGLGTTAGSVGDTVYKGGDGYAGSASQGSPGGGGAGSTGNGGDAGSVSGGAGTSVGGGTGGNRRTTQNIGYTGYQAGGGGGGAFSSSASRSGGTGATGQAKLSYVWSSGWAVGKRGQALDFDGTADYVDTILSSIGATFTVSAWIKPADVGAAYAIAGKRSATSRTWAFYVRPTGNLGFTLNGINDYNSSDGGLRAGAWQNVVLVVNGTALTIYRDGSSVRNTAMTNTVVDDSMTLNIGASGAGGTKFDGSIDEVRVYNRALSATEVANLYSSSKKVLKVNTSQNSKLTTGLVGMWSFNGPDISGVTAFDRSGQNNHGTISGAKLDSGKVGQALKFDGANDYIQAVSTTSIDNIFNGGGSIAAWAYPQGWGENNLGRITDKTYDTLGSYGWLLAVNNNASYAPLQSLRFARSFGGGGGIGAWNTPANSLKLNQWQHVAVVYSDDSTSNDPVLYINGISQTISETSAPSGLLDGDENLNLRVGNESSGTTRSFNGSIDEVRIYNRALSASEIQRLYNMGR